MKLGPLLNFGVEICNTVAKYGGFYLFEHPWTSKAWAEPRVRRLLEQEETLLAKNDQCMFRLVSRRGVRHKKPTGWMTNHEGIANALSRVCDHSHEHEHVLGSGPGGSKSTLSQEYPQELVDTVLKAYGASLDEIYSVDQLLEQRGKLSKLYHEVFAEELKEGEIDYPDEPESREVLEDGDVIKVGEDEFVRCLPREKPFSLQQLVRRAHCGLGHVSNDRLVRILTQAKASDEAIKIARNLECPTCKRHQHVHPARRAAPPRELHANQILGVDTLWLPGLRPGGKLRMALNMVDWATRFQLVIPLKDHTPGSARRAVQQWSKIFGPPERIYVDLGKEFRGAFSAGMEMDSILMDPGSLEMPTQRSITERAGRTFKEVLSKTLMETTCKDWEQWHEAVDVVNGTINRLMNKSGYSPIQRMIGYTPRVPGGLLTGGSTDWATSSLWKAGDLQVQHSVNLRKQAAIAFHEADANQSLRNALHGGERKLHSYQVGDLVYFWRKGMARPKKDSPAFWHGPARVILTNPPNSIWVSHQGHVVKASPEHLRPATQDEEFTLTGWIDAIADTRKRLQEGDKAGYIILDELPPRAEDHETEEADDPAPEDVAVHSPLKKPRFQIHGKTPASRVTFDDLPDRSDVPDPDLQPVEPVSEDTLPGTRDDQSEAPAAGEPSSSSWGTGPKPQEVDTRTPAETRLRPDEDGDAEVEERPQKRTRTEFLEVLLNSLTTGPMARKRKEAQFKEMTPENQARFNKAILKEVSNNLESGAYELLDPKTSEGIRRDKPELILKSRYVLTEKPVEPEDVEKLTKEGLLLDAPPGQLLKAKARHVMKGFSEAGAEHLESTTPQVAQDSVILTLQILASQGWDIGHLDFTQAFHSGGPIARELFAELPAEGLPGATSRQLLRLKKTCYGLTDGPWAWYKHISDELLALGYQISRGDPCLFYLIEEGSLTGIISLATDDMVHGGGDSHWSNMQGLNKRYKMGKFSTGNGRFTGKEIVKNADGSIRIHQGPYVLEKVHEIQLTKERRRRRYSRCTAEEVSALRTLVGALAWVGKETRPDICGRVSLLQQSFPEPLVKDILEANLVAKELHSDPELGILIQPIPLERLRVGVVTDASWANTGDQHTEDNEHDHWEETPAGWTRFHRKPRSLLFHPGAAPGGPDLHDLSRRRLTIADDETVQDNWDSANGIRRHGEQTWTGQTHFFRSDVVEECYKPINERFLQLARRSSQGGYILIYYDSELETSGKAEQVTIAGWKSYKIKRCTVNTLSAECQSMLQGIGNVHWHRFLFAEVLGEKLSLEHWEKEIGRTPFIAVTDSKSLYDTATKCRNVSSHIDDKRTAIDLSILKRDLQLTKGQVRWVAGVNMISDSLTKRMSASFLRKVMQSGTWSLSEAGHQDVTRVQASFNIMWCRCESDFMSL